MQIELKNSSTGARASERITSSQSGSVAHRCSPDEPVSEVEFVLIWLFRQGLCSCSIGRVISPPGQSEIQRKPPMQAPTPLHPGRAHSRAGTSLMPSPTVTTPWMRWATPVEDGSAGLAYHSSASSVTMPTAAASTHAKVPGARKSVKTGP